MKADAPGVEPSPDDNPFAGMLDIKLPLSVILGSGRIAVRDCLDLRANSIVRLTQAAGDDVQVLAGGVPLARGEVVIIEDHAAVRITEIIKPTTPEER